MKAAGAFNGLLRENYAHAVTCGGYMTKAANLRATIIDLLHARESGL